MRKQGHTHKFGHCITMTTGQSKEPVRKVTCKTACGWLDKVCVCLLQMYVCMHVYGRRLQKDCIKKERKKNMQIQFLLIFSYDSKSSTTKESTLSLINLLLSTSVLDQPEPAVLLCMCMREKRKNRESTSLFVSLNVSMSIRSVDRLQDKVQAH